MRHSSDDGACAMSDCATLRLNDSFRRLPITTETRVLPGMRAAPSATECLRANGLSLGLFRLEVATATLVPDSRAHDQEDLVRHADHVDCSPVDLACDRAQRSLGLGARYRAART